MAKIDERFIIELNGEQFVTYEGLLDLAHQEGLLSIEVDLLQIPSKDNGGIAIAKATAKTKDKAFVDIGDAGPNSTNSIIRPHIIRMASTRAKARALRDLTNVGMTAIEELADDNEDKQNRSNNNKKFNTSQTSNSNDDLATDKQRRFLYKLAKEKGFEQTIPEYIKKNFAKDSSKKLTKQEASQIIQMLQEMN